MHDTLASAATRAFSADNLTRHTSCFSNQCHSPLLTLTFKVMSYNIAIWFVYCINTKDRMFDIQYF